MTQFITSALSTAQKTLQAFIEDQDNIDSIAKAIKFAVETYGTEGKLITCGNGGSLCDAAHCAEELTGRFHKDRPALAAITINDPGHITCVANDYGYEAIFSRQVEALGKKEDLLIAISTSGNSQNVVNAVEAANKKGIKSVGLLGKDGGKLKELVTLPIVVDSTQTERIQEIHIKIIHILIEGIERELFPELY